MKGHATGCLVLLAFCWIEQGQLAMPAHAGLQQDAESDVILQSEISRKFASKADQILRQTDQFSKKVGIRFLGADYFLPTWARLDDGTNDSLFVTGKTVEFRSESYWFTFRVDDGCLVSFYNPQITDFEDGRNAPLFDKPDIPAWNVDYVITLATKFRDMLEIPLNVNLGSPSAKYQHTSYELTKSPSGKTITKSHIGYWSVNWPRVDRAGHPFYGDGVNISLSEKYGLSGARFDLFTPFVERKDNIITPSDALSVARIHIAQTSFWERYFSSFSKKTYETIIGDKLVSRDLMVVMPNHIISWNIFASPTKPEGRLVWNLWFKPIHKGPPTEPTYDDRFAVWIDAYSGEIVGGDAML